MHISTSAIFSIRASRTASWACGISAAHIHAVSKEVDSRPLLASGTLWMYLARLVLLRRTEPALQIRNRLFQRALHWHAGIQPASLSHRACSRLHGTDCRVHHCGLQNDEIANTGQGMFRRKVLDSDARSRRVHFTQFGHNPALRDHLRRLYDVATSYMGIHVRDISHTRFYHNIRSYGQASHAQIQMATHEFLQFNHS